MLEETRSRLLVRSAIALLILLSAAACTINEGGPVAIRVETVSGTPVPTMPVPEGNEVVVNMAVSLHSGPGSYYEDLGATFPGELHPVMGRDDLGDWYQLADGSWILSFAVSGRPDVPVVTEGYGRILADVVDVLDGDTITVRYDNRTREIRYIMANAPQVDQLFGRQSYEQNLALVGDQQVLLESDIQDQDAYGRYLRYVYLEDGSMLNEEMLRSGYAQLAVFRPNVLHLEELKKAEGIARTQSLGIWGQDFIAYRETVVGCLYTIQPRESLFIIARRFGVPLADLASANGLENPNLVRDGVDLLIPGCGEDPPVLPTPTLVPDGEENAGD